jgi:hypothetical protein
MKSSSYTQGLAMLLEHIDNAKNSVHSSLCRVQGISQTTEEQARNGHHLCSQITFRSRLGLIPSRTVTVSASS